MKPDNSICFETKEEANERRIKESLLLSPHERLLFFLKLSEEMQFFVVNEPHPNRAKNNLILD